MPIVFGEQPPHDVEIHLKEWLARFANQVNIFAQSSDINGGGSGNDPHLFMRWAGTYKVGAYYRVGDVVIDTNFTMICVNDTFDRAAPQPDGDPVWSLDPNPTWTIPTSSDDILSSNKWTFLQEGWISEARVWVPSIASNIAYDLAFTKQSVFGDITGIIPIPLLNDSDWTIFGNYDVLVEAGDTLEIVLETAGPSTNGYVTLVGNWPANNPFWADVNGSLFINGIDQNAGNDAFGVDILFQQALLSPDWEVVSFP